MAKKDDLVLADVSDDDDKVKEEDRDSDYSKEDLNEDRELIARALGEESGDDILSSAVSGDLAHMPNDLNQPQEDEVREYLRGTQSGVNGDDVTEALGMHVEDLSVRNALELDEEEDS